MKPLAWFASLVPLPVVIDGPGLYVTRAGEQVAVHLVGARHRFDCIGHYASGQLDRWHKSGRLYFGQRSPNDIIRKA